MSSYKDCASCMVFNAKNDVTDAIKDAAVFKKVTVEELKQRIHEEQHEGNDNG